MNRHLVFLGLAIGLFALSIACQSAHAALYFFSQSGFDRDGLGGRVTGSFRGVDRSGLMHFDHLTDDSLLIPDGKITMCSGRGCQDDSHSRDVITDFEIQFSGNPFFESLNKEDGGLGGLDYDLSTNSLEVYYGDYYQRFQYSSSLVVMLALGDYPYMAYANVTQPIVVSQVPLPSAIIFFIPGLLGLGLLRRKVKV